MSSYHIVKQNIHCKQVSVDTYERCLNYNHQQKDAYCPLCHRFVEGSSWEGPYQFYVRSLNLTEVLFPLAPIYMLLSQRFVDSFCQAGLTGIKHLKNVRCFTREKRYLNNTIFPFLNTLTRLKSTLCSKTKKEKRTSRCQDAPCV